MALFNWNKEKKDILEEKLIFLEKEDFDPLEELKKLRAENEGLKADLLERQANAEKLKRKIKKEISSLNEKLDAANAKIKYLNSVLDSLPEDSLIFGKSVAEFKKQMEPTAPKRTEPVFNLSGCVASGYLENFNSRYEKNRHY